MMAKYLSRIFFFAPLASNNWFFGRVRVEKLFKDL